MTFNRTATPQGSSIPRFALERFWLCARPIREHNRKRAEFVRVYGRERGLDEFRCLHPTAPSQETIRDLLRFAERKGFTKAEFVRAAMGAA